MDHIMTSHEPDVISERILDLMDMRYLAAQRQDWEAFDRITRAIDDETSAARMRLNIQIETLGGGVDTRGIGT